MENIKKLLSKEWLVLIGFVVITYSISYLVEFIDDKFSYYKVQYVLEDKPIKDSSSLFKELPLLNGINGDSYSGTLGKYKLHILTDKEFRELTKDIPKTHYFVQNKWEVNPLVINYKRVRDKDILIVGLGLYLLRLFILVTLGAFRTIKK